MELVEFFENMAGSISSLHDSIHALHRKVDQVMAVSDDINAAVQAATDALTSLAQRVTDKQAEMQAEIDALKAANPGIDTTALEAKLAELKTMADSVDAAAPAPAPTPEPAPAPTDGGTPAPAGDGSTSLPATPPAG